MALPIFTIQSFNQSALQPVGAVFAQRVESISVAKSSFTGFSSPNTGRSTAMEKKMNDLTKALLNEINSQAKATYPNAVALVDLNLHFSNIGKNGDNIMLAGQAAATALVKRKTPVVPIAAPIAAPMAAPIAEPAAMAAPQPGPVVMSQPMAAPGPSQPMDMAMAMAQPSQPMVMAPPVPEPMASQPIVMAPPVARPVALPMAQLGPVPQQGARRNRRRTVNRNKRSSRKNRR